MARASILGVTVGSLLLASAGVQAASTLPDAPTLLADLGLSPDEIAQVEAGKMIEHAFVASSEREIVAGLAFHVAGSPDELIDASRQNLLDRVDPNMVAFGDVSDPGTVSDFAKLTLGPDSGARVKAYLGARAGEDLNLSSEEIAAFQKLGKGASPAAVEAEVRSALLARVEAYRAKGLAGIAPYARGGGKERSPADELRLATEAVKKLEQYAPTAYHYLLSYPAGRPTGTREHLRWSQFKGHGVPTIVLTQVLLVPDGDVWIAAQRQFYVSTGYNSEQAVAVFLPAPEGGTVVVYANRTSTDQVTGFGGGAKRSIGSRLMGSQLQALFERAREKLK